MKRVLILAVVMVLMFCSCDFAKKTTDETKTEKATFTESDIEKVEGNGDVFSTISGSNDKKKEKALEDLGKLVDLSKYEDPYESDSGFSIKLKEEANYEIDKTIILSNNATVTLPISYEEIKNAGWSLSESREDEKINGVKPEEGMVKYAVSTGTYLSNDKEERISVSISNTSTETKQTKECDIYELEFDKFQGTAPFTLTNGITEKSTYADVVSVMGSPNKIGYSIYESDDEIKEWFIFDYYSGDGTYTEDEINFEFLYSGEMDSMRLTAGFETEYRG